VTNSSILAQRLSELRNPVPERKRRLPKFAFHDVMPVKHRLNIFFRLHAFLQIRQYDFSRDLRAHLSTTRPTSRPEALACVFIKLYTNRISNLYTAVLTNHCCVYTELTETASLSVTSQIKHARQGFPLTLASQIKEKSGW